MVGACWDLVDVGGASSVSLQVWTLCDPPPCLSPEIRANTPAACTSWDSSASITNITFTPGWRGCGVHHLQSECVCGKPEELKAGAEPETHWLTCGVPSLCLLSDILCDRNQTLWRTSNTQHTAASCVIWQVLICKSLVFSCVAFCVYRQSGDFKCSSLPVCQEIMSSATE